VERWRQNRKELARVLEKNPDTISWWAGEGAMRRMEDPDFEAQMNRVDEELDQIARNLTASQ
jgi:hypothetical protein